MKMVIFNFRLGRIPLKEFIKKFGFWRTLKLRTKGNIYADYSAKGIINIYVTHTYNALREFYYEGEELEISLIQNIAYHIAHEYLHDEFFKITNSTKGHHFAINQMLPIDRGL